VITGNAVSKAAQSVARKAPVIGGVIDFTAQVAQGEEVDDAAVKAVAHTGIGMAGMAAGAAIGAAIGSTVPGVGTVIGLVIGALGGMAFDFVYDKYISS
jgi:phage tail tape-measure protein